MVDPKAQATERLLKRLAVAIKTFGLYPRQHPMAAKTLEGLLASIRPYLETYGTFVVRITRQSFMVDSVTFEGDAYSGLAFYLYTRKLSMLTVLPAATDEELASFLSIAGMDRVSVEAAGGVGHLLWQSGVGDVQVIEIALDEEQEVEALGLNAFLALIGRGRLAPREREAVLDILVAADQTARLLQNVYLMAAEVFEGIDEEERIEHAYRAARTLDRVILDEPVEAQAMLYANLTEALFLVADPLRSALPRKFVSRAGEDTSAKYLLHQCSIEQLGEMILRAITHEDLLGQVAGLLRALSLPARKAEALLSLLETRLRPEGAEAAWLSAAIRPYLAEPAGGRNQDVPFEFVFDDSLIVIDHEDLAQRLREARAIDEPGATCDVIITLIDVLRGETDEEKLLDVAETLTQYVSWMVDHHEYVLLATVLERLKRIAATSHGAQSTLAAGIVKRTTEHPLLDRLLAALWTGRETPVEGQVRQCLAVVADDAVIPLVRFLGGEPRAGMRAILCDLLVAIGRGHVGEFASFISDERWYLIRNIANILGRLQNPQAVPHLARIKAHPEYRVRREVVDALARLSTEGAQALLVQLLDDPDQRIQMKAVQALNAWGARQALPRLLALLQTPDRLHRLFHLKVGALEALERLGATEALPVLRRLARNPLPIGRRRRELRNLARRAVHAIRNRPDENQETAALSATNRG